MELPNFMVLLVITFCFAHGNQGLPSVNRHPIGWQMNMERSRCVKACSQYSEEVMTGSWDEGTRLCSCLDASGHVTVSASILTIDNNNRHRLGIKSNRVPCTEYHVQHNLPCTID
ncbi:uncharacterized protein LOC135162169 [Diachasmimorpha longicaudata]|uniref:uncharacterized protein LOC135162169 n=1 Tax=Diachasmimorpha longicaudata TaxID=58733 RepID=UPI0030B8DE07